MSYSQTPARKNEDRARAEAFRNVSLENVTPTNKKLIKSHKVVELESNSNKKRLANNSPAEMCRILGSSAERLQQRMDVKAQRELHKENRKNRRLELKTDHARQQQAFELQKLELHTWASAALFAIIQERQNQGHHYTVKISLISIKNYPYTSNTITIISEYSLVYCLISIDLLYHNLIQLSLIC